MEFKLQRFADGRRAVYINGAEVGPVTAALVATFLRLAFVALFPVAAAHRCAKGRWPSWFSDATFKIVK